MKTIFTPQSVVEILKHGIEVGHWTMEQLDFPTASYERMIQEARRSRFFGADFYPPAPYVNPLRKQTTVSVDAEGIPTVDVATATSPNKGQPDVDLCTGQRAPLPGVDHGPDRQGPQNRVPDQPNHGDKGYLGAAWHDSSPGSRELHQQQVEPSPQGSADLDADW